MRYDCGCENEEVEFGVLHCVKKCEYHVSWLLTHNEDTMEYYTTMGCIRNGIPHNKQYIVELQDAFNSIDCSIFKPITNPGRSNGSENFMLEIGCGVGVYVPFFLKQGWVYAAVELSKFAAYWTRNCFDVPVEEAGIEKFDGGRYDLIFSAHTLEHLEDAPEVMKKCYGMLIPKGKLALILPDDTDKINPSHWWFFNENNLSQHLKAVGFKKVRTVVRKIVAHENFIYCVAERGE